MSAPKIAALLAIAGTFGVIVSVILGSLIAADYLLDIALVCLMLAGVIACADRALDRFHATRIEP